MMVRDSLHLLKTAFLLLILLSVLTGAFYPMVVTGLANLAFRGPANGSLLAHHQGSALIGQSFTSPRYFWGRPSATLPYPYNSAASRASNLGPTNPALITAIKDRLKILHQSDPTNTDAVPIDLVTTSGSGLDPDISPAAAFYQAPRIARSRGLTLGTVQALIKSQTQARTWGFLGEPRVNVLELNIALDHLKKD